MKRGSRGMSRVHAAHLPRIMGTVPGTRCLGQLARDEISCQHDQIAERASAKQTDVRLTDSRGSPVKEAVDLGELVDRRLTIRPDQRVGQLDQHPLRLGAVDVGIDTVEITQRALEPKPARLEHEPLVPRLPVLTQADRQAQLEGHVEAGRPAPDLDQAQIVKGVAARRDQLEDALESRIGARKLQGCARPEAEAAQPSNEREEQLLVARIVRNVQECVVAGVALGDVAAAALARSRARRCRALLRRDGMAARRFRLPDTRRFAILLAALAEQIVQECGELPHALLRDPECLGGRTA